MASPSIIGNLRVNLGLDARQFQQGARGSTTQVNTLRSALGPLTTGLRGVGAAMRTAFQFAGFTSLVGLAVTLGQKFFDLVKVTGGSVRRLVMSAISGSRHGAASGRRSM
ncbi:hypothetical protein [Ketogulonicigenium vulgare]|uniref:hypothetical protein n=1 Tax=Ketogulonicigenium vulgare TaxID=92945 RepID=UPI0020C78EF2|nr:hypothetical protein [Ketogulonicigenium vulgare]